MTVPEKNFFARFKHMRVWLWLKIMSAVVILAGVVSFFSNILAIIESGENIPYISETFFGKDITAKFIPSESIKRGERVSLIYTLPATGYYSLWNQNNTGKMIKLFPDDHKPSSSSYKRDKPFEYVLRGNKSDSLERMIVLWSDHSAHPPQVEYLQWSDFKDYLDTHHYEWKTAEATVQVL